MPRVVVVIQQYEAVLYAGSMLYGSLGVPKENNVTSVCLSASLCQPAILIQVMN